jgi:hypothetical protein
MVNWTATDRSGNSNSCPQLVIVLDTQPPSITCPADVTVSTDAGQCYASGVVLSAPATGDNCSVASVSSNAPVQFPLGTNTVTWTASDPSGNSDTCPQLVIVRLAPATIQISRLADHNISLSLNALCNLPFRIEAATNLLNWETLTNYSNPAEAVEYLDLDATNSPQRFYRAVWTP